MKRAVTWRTRIQIVVGLALTLGCSNLSLGALGQRYSHLGPLLGREVLWWALTAAVVAYVLLVERRPLASIGFKRLSWGSLWAIPAGVALFMGVPFLYFTVFPLLHLHMNSGEMSKLLATPFWYRLMLVTRAAVCEEILFRGYPIPRLEELTGSTPLAAVLSWLVFTLAHLGAWGWAQLLIAGYGGIILTALFLWRRDLGSNILAHFIGDGAGFLLS